MTPKRLLGKMLKQPDPLGAMMKAGESVAKARRSAAACSRFSAARIEELLQASNDLSEGDAINYEDARDLALYALDELERVRNAYQARLMDLANAAVKAMQYPEND